MNRTATCLFLLFYVITAIQDLAKKTIDVRVLTLFAAAGTALNLFGLTVPDTGGIAFSSLTLSAAHFFAALLPGIAMLVFSRLSRGALGAGDGLFMLTAALYLSVSEIWLLVCSGVIVSGICGIIILSVGMMQKRDYRRHTLPLLPCMLPGALIICAVTVQTCSAG